LLSRFNKSARRANHPKTLSSPSCKNISLNPSGKSSLEIRPSHPMRGAGRDRHERAVGCGGRGSCD
jgi:hypothetical protein